MAETSAKSSTGVSPVNHGRDVPLVEEHGRDGHATVNHGRDGHATVRDSQRDNSRRFRYHVVNAPWGVDGKTDDCGGKCNG